MQSMDPGLVADVLVNLFGALGAVVVAYNLGRSDPNGPVSVRLLAALLLVAGLFLARSLAWTTGERLLETLADMLAGMTPLAALVVAEGLTRRHAPRWAKLAVLLGAAAVIVTSLTPARGTAAGSLLLLLVVPGGWALVGGLLWRRARDGLAPAENRTVDRVVVAMALLTPLIATDFRSLWPDVPVRLGALGALVLMFLAFGSAAGRRRTSERFVGLAVLFAIAAILAFGQGLMSDEAMWLGGLRSGVVAAAGLIFAALFSEVLVTRSERMKPVDPLLTADSARTFEADLAAHPLFAGARILSGSDIAHVAHPDFQSLLDDRPVLRRSESPWGRTRTDDGVERADSLLATYEATHLLRLASQPLRLAVFALPAIASDPRSESEITAVQRVAELLHAKDPGR